MPALFHDPVNFMPADIVNCVQRKLSVHLQRTTLLFRVPFYPLIRG